MTTTSTKGPAAPPEHSGSPVMRRPHDERRLPWFHLVLTGLAGLLVAIALLAIFDALSIPAAILLGFVLHLAFGYLYSRIREGRRWATDRLMTLVVIGAFAIAMFPLVSLLWAVIGRGLTRVLAAAPRPSPSGPPTCPGSSAAQRPEAWSMRPSAPS